MTEFGQMAELATEWEREGLGTWVYFDDPNPNMSVMIAAPKNELNFSGCSVFFQNAVTLEKTKETARSIVNRYSLKQSKWCVADSGEKLNIV